MDFDHLINELVRKAEPDIDSRLESQAEALKELECTNPVLGRWIDEYDVDYLIAAFNLDDEEFSSNFPAMGSLSQHDRSQIIEAFEQHFDQCPHCFLKRGYDMEMNARIERAYRDNSTAVIEHLESTPLTSTEEDEVLVATTTDTAGDIERTDHIEHRYDDAQAVQHVQSPRPLPTSKDEILAATQNLMRAAAVKRSRK